MVPIYFDELVTFLKACTRLRPDECSPTQLRRVAADHLAPIDPGLAAKVADLSGPALVALSAFILQAQALVGMTGGDGPTAAGQAPAHDTGRPHSR